jgi:hypothetical protein
MASVLEIFCTSMYSCLLHRYLAPGNWTSGEIYMTDICLTPQVGAWSRARTSLEIQHETIFKRPVSCRFGAHWNTHSSCFLHAFLAFISLAFLTCITPWQSSSPVRADSPATSTSAPPTPSSRAKAWLSCHASFGMVMLSIKVCSVRNPQHQSQQWPKNLANRIAFSIFSSLRLVQLVEVHERSKINLTAHSCTVHNFLIFSATNQSVLPVEASLAILMHAAACNVCARHVKQLQTSQCHQSEQILQTWIMSWWCNCCNWSVLFQALTTTLRYSFDATAMFVRPREPLMRRFRCQEEGIECPNGKYTPHANYATLTAAGWSDIKYIYILYIYNITKMYRKPGKKCKKHESMSRGYKGFWQHQTGVIANSLRRWVHWQSWLQRGDLLHSKLLPSKALRDPQTSTLSTLALLLKASQSCFVIFYW